MTLFYLFAAVAVLASLLVISQRNPIYSVLLLIASFGALSGLYVLLEAPFVAVTQIIVYAGAIMVLFLFVIMLLNLTEDAAETRHQGRALFRLGAWIGGGILAGELSALFLRLPFGPPPAVAAGYGGAEAVATSLFVEYLLPFELTSILLLIAVVGAVVLAQRRAA
jgi:NADH-quinone oxidoreductase subunit J